MPSKRKSKYSSFDDAPAEFRNRTNTAPPKQLEPDGGDRIKALETTIVYVKMFLVVSMVEFGLTIFLFAFDYFKTDEIAAPAQNINIYLDSEKISSTTVSSTL